MVDMIGALALAAVLVIDVTVLVGLAPFERGTKLIAFTAAAAWAVVIVAVAAIGGFAPGAAGPVPAVAFAFAIPVIAGLVAWFASPTFRNGLASVPTAALVGVNAFRVLGFFFLILSADGRLPAPFAPSAGWGDVITGLLAIPLAVMAARDLLPNRLLGLWNAFGALDLLVAVGLGILSAPGTPYQLFGLAGPNTGPLGELPWVLIPTLLVPFYLLTHLVIAAQVWSAREVRWTALAH